MFLETVEYKLKNRVYHKVEHVVRDFRRIVYNSKLYHKVRILFVSSLIFARIVKNQINTMMPVLDFFISINILE